MKYTKLYKAPSVIFLFVLLLGCKPESENQFYKIGFSQCVSSDKWRQAMHDEMHRELLFYPEFEFEIKDAKGNNKTQIKQINEFIKQGVDLLIVSPNEAEPITSVIEKAYRSGIPVITVDRKTTSNQYSSFIGADNYEIGKTAGQYAQSLISEGDKVIEIWGLQGSTPAIERHKGFNQQIGDNYEKVNVYSDWSEEKATNELLKIIDNHLDVDLIYAHNDRMALAAYQICLNKGISEKVKFIGIDGLSGSIGGIQAVQDGLLDATLLYPTGGEQAIRLAATILRGQPFNKENILATTLINSKNVQIFKLQTDKIISQQRDIERQKERITNQSEVYKIQRLLVYLLSSGILVIFGLAVYLYYGQKERQRINRELESKNKEIILQQNKIIKYSKEAEEANAARFRFFTNISHEFRTPLTLILGPVEELMRLSKKLPSKIQTDIQLIQKNTYRLLRLINQLMEFRKLENGKLKVKASENDLIDFVSEIVLAFRLLAEEKKVNFDYLHSDLDLKLWFDVNMIDKVIFNLLSNAFKFTPAGGNIKVQIINENKVVKIIVEDNGRGMSKEHVVHAFDRFYQGESYSAKGSGLGLSLTKELIELHSGEIVLKSERGLGTRFEVMLRKGHDHFTKEEKLDTNNPFEIEGNEYINHLSDISIIEKNDTKTDQKILIVEDDEDLLLFVKNHLSEYYEIIQCDNGEKAIHLAQEEVPDLVVTDVLLGRMDGFEVTKTIKSDIRTSHIPVVIMTSKTDDEFKVQGMQAGADQYITKPFRIEYLLESIKSHLKSRELLKRHFNINENQAEEANQFPIDLDKSFIEDFKKVVIENMKDPGVNVDFFCRELGLSRIQLYRKVKALLGQSVNDYLNDMRLSNAQKLLRTDLSISEIAYQSGFSSPAYFSTAFKSKFKVSPSDYKSSIR